MPVLHMILLFHRNLQIFEEILTGDLLTGDLLTGDLLTGDLLTCRSFDL